MRKQSQTQLLLIGTIILSSLSVIIAKSTVQVSKEQNQILRLDNFNKELFWEEPDEGLYEVDVGLRAAEGETGSHLQAFADINNDRYTDIITINEAKTVFTVHLYEPAKKMFVYQKSFKPSDCQKITNIAVGRSVDRIRLFITCQTSSISSQSTSTSNHGTVIKLFDKYGKYVDFEEQKMQIPIESGSQPFIADLNGDYLEDIIYTDVNHDIKVAFQKRNPAELFVTDFDQALLVTDETEGCLQKKNVKRKLSVPHSTSLIDFDGDCLSDLFITVTEVNSGKSFYEIYIRREKELQDDLNQDDPQNISANQTQLDSSLRGMNTFCLVSREEIPSSTNNLFHFADVDRDAMIDMLFVTKNDLSLHVYHNKLQNLQNTLNQQGQSGLGQNFKQVCADTNRPINKIKDIFQSFSQIEEKYVVKQLISKDSNAVDMYSDDEQSMPGRLYIGDVTSDGFPDILITMKYINGTTKSHILVNSPCDSMCTPKAAKAKRRTFNLQYNQYQNLLDQFDKVRYAVFFDLNENSMMDIILVKGEKSEISAIYNNFAKDAFFLKSRVISDESIGNTLHSASFRCILTDLDEQKFISMTGQSGQTAFQALQMPFAQIGIGRSNNFIEQFTVAVPTNGTRVMKRWTPIIPKSVLFVMVKNDDQLTIPSSDLWGLDVLVKPNEKMILILLVDAVFLLILGLIIIILHLLEKAKDRKEAKSFDYF
ncbi:UNKNOWN [Stylonychia lemnae]|uniref:T-cell immunomodulatory protein TIP C2 domain-containing protein n=1 Tax=Stylonychia lemnae TaxID=5949 RepID=A0A077ZVJ6_STYLE|nr:UNKNOWN [Stylonychia lemnae]|eukprot:CDW73884.1 UNKNOWN [Stylonychia lemnae]